MISARHSENRQHEDLIPDGPGREGRRLPLGAPGRLTGSRAQISHRVADKIPESGPLFVGVVQDADDPEPAGGKMPTALRPMQIVDVCEDLRRQA